MYLDTTASRAGQHRAAMEKHAQAARQAKIARAATSKAHRAPAEKAAPTLGLRGWAVTAFARKARPATHPVTV
jgi:hypothetical protein